MINIWREKCIILAHVNHFHLPFNFQFDHLETDETTNALTKSDVPDFLGEIESRNRV